MAVSLARSPMVAHLVVPLSRNGGYDHSQPPGQRRALSSIHARVQTWFSFPSFSVLFFWGVGGGVYSPPPLDTSLCSFRQNPSPGSKSSFSPIGNGEWRKKEGAENGNVTPVFKVYTSRSFSRSRNRLILLAACSFRRRIRPS